MLGFKKVKDDPLYNRRRFMVVMTVYAITWGFIILFLHITNYLDLPGASLFLGYIATLSTAGLFAYFKQASKEPPEELPEPPIKGDEE